MNHYAFLQAHYKQHTPLLQSCDMIQFIQRCDYEFMERNYHGPAFIGAQSRKKGGGALIHIPLNENESVGLLPTSTNQIAFQETAELHPFTFRSPIITEPPLILPKKQIFINVDINRFQDLIQLVRDNEYQENCEYNIDLRSLHKIKSELEELNRMIGLDTFKEEILNQLLYFAQHLHRGKNRDFMHTVLCGPPGTGKTEAAMILGKMYSKLGILKNNIFRKVSRSDLIAGYLGQTALKTKKVIDECLGGCLFIDEAYSLANDFSGDSFSRECIDVLCESMSAHKDELMVIIAGYEDQLDDTFFKANQGLKSRFIWRFHLQQYTAKELAHIFLKKCNENEWTLGESADELTQWIEKRKSHFVHFGRDMELLFSYSKISHGRRIYGKHVETIKALNMSDIDKGYEKFRQNSSHKISTPPMGMYS